MDGEPGTDESKGDKREDGCREKRWMKRRLWTEVKVRNGKKEDGWESERRIQTKKKSTVKKMDIK